MEKIWTSMIVFLEVFMDNTKRLIEKKSVMICQIILKKKRRFSLIKIVRIKNNYQNKYCKLKNWFRLINKNNQ